VPRPKQLNNAAFIAPREPRLPAAPTLDAQDMYFNKFPYPANFGYLERGRGDKAARAGNASVRFDIAAFEGGIFRLTARSPQWTEQHSQARLTPPRPTRNGASGPRLDVGEGFALTLRDGDGQTLLRSPAGMTFGVSGDASIFLFQREPDCQFYGMGEKTFGLEQSGRVTKFWNTDAWGDFAEEVYRNGRPDPYYVSIPYLIVKRGNRYVGLLLHNPHATFASTNTLKTWTGQDATSAAYKDCFWLGAEAGLPELYILVGPTLAELTAKLQRLVGVTPLPPAWALGYHQCRWGYESARDLAWLDANFRQYEIPCDGLWLDIGYMDGFRVFTSHPERFPQLRQTLADLRRRGRRVVPILDPGVKREAGFAVYAAGQRADVFCRNAAGGEFVGMVWPGETVFPDFSLESGRAWWAQQVKRFADNGFSGAWLDMNDPSTGNIDPQGMLFNHGRQAHDTFHNQYALGMAQASREGFIAATGERSFLLCRSGFISSSRHTAIWTGDNVSNYHYLRLCIAGTLNLALSGQPFNAPDIGGFGDNTRAELFSDWMKCCCLFPVCRVHTSINTARQEPWAFGEQVMAVLRHYIRLRYKLRPYLYNLFAAQ
jgi:alpha-glucosidase